MSGYFKIVLAVIGAIVLLFAVSSISALLSDSGAVELSKQEALRLMDLQTRAVMAAADRDEFVNKLFVTYGVDPKTHNLNIATGQFVPVEVTNEKISPPAD